MSYLPLKYWTDFDLKCTLEYPVSDFAAELRWMKEVVGFTLLSESEDYAIVTDAGHHFTFSFKQYDGPQPDLSAMNLQLFTDDFDAVFAELQRRCPGVELRWQAKQRIAYTRTPAGLPFEIWSGWEG